MFEKLFYDFLIAFPTNEFLSCDLKFTQSHFSSNFHNFLIIVIKLLCF